jgi:hypothetical protein
MNEVLLTLATSIIVALLGGGLLGAIYTGRQTKASIVQYGADTLKTYQEIAALASASELQARKEREVAQKRYEEIISTLEVEKEIRVKENEKLKDMLSEWNTGIKILHNQISEFEKKPRWTPSARDIDFLEEDVVEERRKVREDFAGEEKRKR